MKVGSILKKLLISRQVWKVTSESMKITSQNTVSGIKHDKSGHQT